MFAPQMELGTEVTRNLDPKSASSLLTVTNTAVDEPVVTIKFCGEWGETYARLSPTEAKQVSVALEEASAHVQDEQSHEERIWTDE